MKLSTGGCTRNKKDVNNELHQIRAQLKTLTTKNATVKELITDKAKTEETGANLLALFRFVMDENKKTTMILARISENLARIESERDADYRTGSENPAQVAVKELPISELDAKIIQCIQIAGMACADDIKKQMAYKGRNAASARLNRLHQQGILERYQLGHKVYYKYDAGKATKTLIVSPPQ
jgi:hypothetical protein